ncbi:histidine kinase [Massilia sp. RP-1-19]|uniref:histidine kinase n=1 Tax=Massilia polaris TaxID=2728846 RepID=A0A848HNW1_9BURK|nr:histidine kinase [Massilia polaris]NML62864.1 histidine kinase [Massilia polaris]
MQMPPPPPTTGFPFRQLARDAGYAAVLNILCAVVITSITRRPENFFENVVYSMCIGMIVLVIADGARLAMWGAHKRPRWPVFFAILAVAVPFAQYAGIALGGLLLGRSVPSATETASKSMNSMLVFTLLAAGAAWLFFVSRDRIVRAEAALALETARAETINRQALQTQLRLLQAQIEPHMLFNTLANLQGLIALDPARAQTMLDQLILYLRATLTSSRSENTTLAHEFALLDAYLGLMSVRMGQRLGYTLDLPPALAGVKLPPMLLQPLVENAIVHGIEPDIDGGHVTVSAAAQDGMVALSIADTGRGLHATPGQAGTGLGVANTRERLAAVYGERASLSLTPNAPHGALARLTLPLQTP